MFFFQAEDGIRDLVRSRGLGDVYKRQILPGDGASRQRDRYPRHVNETQQARTDAEAGLGLSLIHI